MFSMAAIILYSDRIETLQKKNDHMNLKYVFLIYLYVTKTFIIYKILTMRKGFADLCYILSSLPDSPNTSLYLITI